MSTFRLEFRMNSKKLLHVNYQKVSKLNDRDTFTLRKNNVISSAHSYHIKQIKLTLHGELQQCRRISIINF